MDHFYSILGIFIFPTLVQASTLSKNDAYEILKNQGYKWGLVNAANIDSQSKLEEATSEFKPKIALAFRQYAARINPIQFGGSNPQTIDTVGFGTSAIEMEWTLMDPIAQAKILSAQATDNVSRAQVKHLQNELTALMLLQYLNVQRLRQQTTLMDANLERSQLILKLAQTKYSIGAGIPLEVAKAKNLVQLDQLKKMATLTKYAKAKNEFLISLGKLDLDKDFSPDLPPLRVKLIKPMSEETLLKRSQEVRNDLKAAMAGFNGALKAREETNKIFFPKLTLLTEVGTTQPTLLGLPAKYVNGFVGAILTIPLETGGLVESKKKEALYFETKTSLQMEQIKAEITTQSKEATQQLQAAEEAVKASADYVKTAEEEARYAEQRFRNGASNILEWTTSHANLAMANDTEIENIYNYELAKISYFRTIGDFTEYFESEKGQ